MIQIFVMVPVKGDKTFQLRVGQEDGPKIPFLHQAVIMRLVRTLTADAQIDVRVIVRNWRDADDIIKLPPCDSPVMRAAVRAAIEFASIARNNRRKATGVIYDGSEDAAASNV